ncbi:MAG: BlaI/MecI/CopY family transcriptional regulator [Lachnospiraceae bacterium]|nr:BlaI/MecI/CopY family transcriptional regulator [Lachnospiraceae bacterium]MDE7202955.1 BlaI/MecI/CopY family transcriptional regulator [Lachnospiraceae bacterium]
MKRNYQLSEREQQVMNFMWDKGEAVTSVEILESLTDVMQNATYVHRTINSLLASGFIRECGVVQHRTQYARKFLPCMTREEYAAKYLVKQGIQRKSLGRIAMALINETQDSDYQNTRETVEELQKIIDELKNQADNFRQE